MKIIQIMPSHDPDCPSEFFALFDDGNIAYCDLEDAGWEWYPIRQPPKDLFETKDFIENNFSQIIYVCEYEESLYMIYNSLNKEEFDYYGYLDELHLGSFLASRFNTFVTRLSTNPLSHFNDKKVIETWVAK